MRSAALILLIFSLFYLVCWSTIYHKSTKHQMDDVAVAINDIPRKFKIAVGEKSSIDVGAIENGLINDTYLLDVSTTVADAVGKKYILQRINIRVFPNVEGLMSNIEKVSKHLQEKSRAKKEKANVTSQFQCLVVVHTIENKSFNVAMERSSVGAVLYYY